MRGFCIEEWETLAKQKQVECVIIYSECWIEYLIMQEQSWFDSLLESSILKFVWGNDEYGLQRIDASQFYPVQPFESGVSIFPPSTPVEAVWREAAASIDTITVAPTWREFLLMTILLTVERKSGENHISLTKYQRWTGVGGSSTGLVPVTRIPEGRERERGVVSTMTVVSRDEEAAIFLNEMFQLSLAQLPIE